MLYERANTGSSVFCLGKSYICLQSKCIFMNKYFLVFFLILGSVIHAQDKVIDVQHDANRILEKKSECLKKHYTDFLYYIQIYNGKDLQQAKSVMKSYLKYYPGSTAFIKWENPEYKVWTGEYMTKIEVEQAMRQIKEHFPNAIVVFPKRR